MKVNKFYKKNKLGTILGHSVQIGTDHKWKDFIFIKITAAKEIYIWVQFGK